MKFCVVCGRFLVALANLGICVIHSTISIASIGFLEIISAIISGSSTNIFILSTTAGAVHLESFTKLFTNSLVQGIISVKLFHNEVGAFNKKFPIYSALSFMSFILSSLVVQLANIFDGLSDILDVSLSILSCILLLSIFNSSHILCCSIDALCSSFNTPLSFSLSISFCGFKIKLYPHSTLFNLYGVFFNVSSNLALKLGISLYAFCNIASSDIQTIISSGSLLFSCSTVFFIGSYLSSLGIISSSACLAPSRLVSKDLYCSLCLFASCCVILVPISCQFIVNGCIGCGALGACTILQPHICGI